MSKKALLSIFSLFGLTIFSFQNCSDSTFSGIDPAMKLETLGSHSGLGTDTLDQRNNQSDNGLGGIGQQSDGGLGMGPQPTTVIPTTPQFDGGMGGMKTNNGGMKTVDGGLGMSPQTDSGLSGGTPQTDGGMSGGMPQVDGGITINPNADGSPNSDGGRNMGGPRSFDPGLDPITNPSEGRFHVIRWCRGRDEGATLMGTRVVQIVVKDGNRVVCQAQGEDLLKQIMDTGQVQLPGCDFSNVPNNRMVVEVTDEKGQSLSEGGENGSTDNAFDDDKVKSDDGRQKFDAVALHLLMQNDVEKRNGSSCDAYNSSPLVVDMRNERELVNIFTLTSPSGGILFDIEGENATPAPHTKKQISWLTDPRIMPIVLPNRGSVDGIDELFGDNTKGPDGRFAANGFKALEKHDDNGDGYITEEDSVFEKLRVWYDRDLNGISQSNELYTLERANITVIDLNYDPNFYSQDKYGNEIKYKSVVQLKNGKLKPVFDIWFTVNNLIQN